MAPPRNRKSNKDAEGTVYMDAAFEKKVKDACFDHDLAFSELGRRAINHYIDNVLAFSHRKQSINSGRLPVNGQISPANTSPNGLFTAEQVAYLLNAAREGQKK